ncbi:maleylpyruvate isomerase N-terminal domain-containing protein [Pseudonocardia humida]|uniref:Maleylpyruvate isomerase N-terminal domain-containing protein n=1 Tax=Pseudonocardia humida TaxID=2800819 RepID=A0ABT1AA94_9PSEU|nr:maleylpyruvate isomerase N-terminal domain-containing protein [Pseudonocardia humida]MCO1659871.1 maleylpyruvate isomerase N-terminal domain-containing protein [Pseudonocardia humida]
MLLTPRYDGTPVPRAEGPIVDPAASLLRRRRRLADILARFDAEQCASPTRCERWTVHDVIMHPVRVNDAWTASIAAAGRVG